MKKIKGLTAVLALMVMLTGCGEYFKVETKTLIDYRYSGEYMEYTTEDGNARSYHHDEKFEVLYEYTYQDGHKERHWEECTRFEYQNAKKELGEVEP